MQMKIANPSPKIEPSQLLNRCLAAFVDAGSIDLSLDQLSVKVGVSKRMLIHYFRSKQGLEEKAITLLEERLRAQLSPAAFPQTVSPRKVIETLWKQTTAPEARNVLLLVMDLSRRAWRGSDRAKLFYAEQQRQWMILLGHFFPDRREVEWVLQVFQGAVLAYLITGDPTPGRRSLRRACSDHA